MERTWRTGYCAPDETPPKGDGGSRAPWRKGRGARGWGGAVGSKWAWGFELCWKGRRERGGATEEGRKGERERSRHSIDFNICTSVPYVRIRDCTVLPFSIASINVVMPQIEHHIQICFLDICERNSIAKTQIRWIDQSVCNRSAYNPVFSCLLQLPILWNTGTKPTRKGLLWHKNWCHLLSKNHASVTLPLSFVQ